jgi:hypothetical protein
MNDHPMARRVRDERVKPAAKIAGGTNQRTLNP